MSEVELHNVEDAVERLRGEVLEHRRTGETWSVVGEETAGKTAVLHSLRSALAHEAGVRPILVTPPVRAYDAGHVALIQLTEALTDNQAKLEAIKDPERPWDDKRRRVRAWLQRDAARPVFLVDEPSEWLPPDSYFRAFVRDIWDLVFDGVGKATVTAGPTPFRVSHLHRLRLDPASDPQGVLDALDAPALAEAKDLVALQFDETLEGLSPLQIRLLVAIAALDPSGLVRIDPSVAERRPELVGGLLELVDSGARALREVWLRLAQVRESFEEDLLTHVGATELDEVADAILRQCLLFKRDGRLVLHDSLCRIPSMTEREPPETHEQLAAYYRKNFIERGGDVGGRLRDAVEAFHHASTAGIVDLDEYKPFFVDQLNILGYHLSYDQRDFRAAAEVFGIALRWEAENAYACHYRAFNLDRLAEAPAEVETLYRRAIELAPSHTWFRSRLISFLIARSRIDDAWSAWLEAIDELDADYDQFYYSLHLHVARMLVYRGEIDLAEIVLRGVPPALRYDPRFIAIQERVDALREVQERGSVLPAPYLRREWWRHGPNLLRESEDGKHLVRWIAARVVGVSGDGVDLEAAEVARTGRIPEYGTIHVPLDSFQRWWRGPGEPGETEVGTFLEIGFYGEAPHVIARAVPYPWMRWPDLAHPGEDPDRYLRRRAA